MLTICHHEYLGDWRYRIHVVLSQHGKDYEGDGTRQYFLYYDLCCQDVSDVRFSLSSTDGEPGTFVYEGKLSARTHTGGGTVWGSTEDSIGPAGSWEVWPG